MALIYAAQEELALTPVRVLSYHRTLEGAQAAIERQHGLHQERRPALEGLVWVVRPDGRGAHASGYNRRYTVSSYELEE